MVSDIDRWHRSELHRASISRVAIGYRSGNSIHERADEAVNRVMADDYNLFGSEKIAYNRAKKRARERESEEIKNERVARNREDPRRRRKFCNDFSQPCHTGIVAEVSVWMMICACFH